MAKLEEGIAIGAMQGAIRTITKKDVNPFHILGNAMIGAITQGVTGVVAEQVDKEFGLEGTGKLVGTAIGVVLTEKLQNSLFGRKRKEHQ